MYIAFTCDENCEWYVCHEVNPSKRFRFFQQDIIEFGVEAIRGAAGKDKMITVNIIEIEEQQIREQSDYASDRQPFIRSSR